MKEKEQFAPNYIITDDILTLSLNIAERIEHLPLAGTGKKTEQEAPFPPMRQKGAGIFIGEQLLGRAPMPQCLEERREQLNAWLEEAAVHPLLKAGVVVYEYIAMQFFEYNNMRLGMAAGEAVLRKWKKQLSTLNLAEALPEQELVAAFEQCDLYGEVGPFLRFFLRSIYRALGTEQESPEIQRLLSCMDEEAYTTKELMERLGLKHRPTFRDKYLLPAMDRGMVEMTIPDKPNSSQQRYRKVQGKKERKNDGFEGMSESRSKGASQ